MKSCKTITGTVVIEIEKGMGLGEVHEVFVDEGVNLTFVIKSKQSAQPFALLSSKNIQGIGDFAVMVENSSVFQDLDEADLQVLNDKQGSIFDEIVITIDGNKVGTVVDYHIDEKNEIGYLVVNPEDAGEEIQIPKSRILMIGKEYIILNDEKKSAVHFEADAELGRLAAADLLAAAAPAQPEPAAAETAAAPEEPVFEPIAAEKEAAADLTEALAAVELQHAAEELDLSAVQVAESAVADLPKAEDLLQEAAEQVSEAGEALSLEADAPSLDAALEEVLTASHEAVETAISTAPVAEEEPAEKQEANDFVSQQKRLLVGKKLQKDLVNADGGVILYAGDTVSDDVIDFLRRIDRKFLIRLAECVV
ncbi:hypothetical protein STRDD11_00602 [Streptococcus sp. DD11]|uniref:PRC-barrel domain-containing protein n=1 Tax=Streptococcus sp. DD11 TaxID=1777879 RepID=UPI000799575A|nr:hypothetical protein [Streptococcus sp. DD11]KXT85000.1 hypothetical protein STRDD11_00602 [Streptococcus sp. DD11]